MNDERTAESDEIDRSGRPGSGSGAAVIDDVTPPHLADAGTAARVDAWLLGAASTGRRPGSSRTGGRGSGRRVLVASAVALALAVGGVLVLTGNKRDSSSAPARSSAAPAVTSVAPAASITTVAAAPATTGPAVATTAATTTVARATTTPATTAAAVTTVVPTTTPATPIGPVPLNEAQRFQSLLDGTYPTGQSWPHGALTGGSLIVTGVVPDAASRAKVLAVFDPPPNGAKVIDSLTVDPTVPAPDAVLWTIEGLDSSSMFAPGSSTFPLADGAVVPQSDTLIALWARRLIDVPAAKMIAVVRRDDDPGTLATSRANAIRLKFQATDAKLENLSQVVTAITQTPSTGSQVAFAQLVAP